MWDDLGEYIINQCKNDNNIKCMNIDDINTNGISANDNNNISTCLDVNNSNNEKSSCKVVEIAIGNFFAVANYLKNNNSENIDFNAIDINPGNFNIVFDDITDPNMEIYDGADIIYSIRPPQELQPYISDIVTKTGAILIIKPLFNEDLNLNLPMKLVNYKKAVFYRSS